MPLLTGNYAGSIAYTISDDDLYLFSSGSIIDGDSYGILVNNGAMTGASISVAGTLYSDSIGVELDGYDSFLLTETGTFAAGFAGIALGDTNNTVTIDGSLNAESIAIGTISSDPSHSSVIVNGSVNAGETGVNFQRGTGHYLEVNGTLSAHSSNPLVETHAIELISVSDSTIVNTGRITSQDEAILIESETSGVEIVNSGTIGSEFGPAIQAMDGSVTIRNSGLIDGSVRLSFGADLYDGTGTGRVNGFVSGRDGNDTLLGGIYNDSLDGGFDADRMVGGDGDDVYYVDDPGDSVSESGTSGNDEIFSKIDIRLTDSQFTGAIEKVTLTGFADINAYGDETDQTLLGNSGANELDGGGGSDLLIGGTEDDVLIDLIGGDTLQGGLGDDGYVIEDNSTLITENSGEGIDTVLSFDSYVLPDNVENLYLRPLDDVTGEGNDRDNVIDSRTGNDLLVGHEGMDNLSSHSGNDTLLGGADTDRLKAGGGDDILDGGSGDDFLMGGGGTDTLTGGSGADIFRYRDDTAFDTITDFEDGTDRIDLSDYREENGGDPIGFDQLLITQNGGDARVELDLDRDNVADVIDLDGDGTADSWHIDLADTDMAALTAADFVF